MQKNKDIITTAVQDLIFKVLEYMPCRCMCVSLVLTFDSAQTHMDAGVNGMAGTLIFATTFQVIALLLWAIEAYSKRSIAQLVCVCARVERIEGGNHSMRTSREKEKQGKCVYVLR